MTKKTIMELLREADEKGDIKGNYYMDRLFGHAMDDANELHFESIEQHVAVHTLDALERIANALESNANQRQTKRTITYSEFFEDFNAVSQGYHACPYHGEVVIVSNPEGDMKASLGTMSRNWILNRSVFSPSELALMAKLADTPSELRGEINDD